MRNIACGATGITSTAMACVRIRIHTCIATKRRITRITARFTAATRFAAGRGTIGRRRARLTAAPSVTRTRIVFSAITFVATINTLDTGTIIQHIRRCTRGRLTGPART